MIAVGALIWALALVLVVVNSRRFTRDRPGATGLTR